MNLASLAMALAGLLIWLFFSPHRCAKQDQIKKIALDRTRKLPSPSVMRPQDHMPFCFSTIAQYCNTEVSCFQPSSWQFFRCPILGMSTHHCVSKCGELHDIENRPPRRFLGILGGCGRQRRDRYDGLGPRNIPNPLFVPPSTHTHARQLPLNAPNCRHQPSLPSLLAGAGCNHE